jgi:hypothetical protein
MKPAEVLFEQKPAGVLPSPHLEASIVPSAYARTTNNAMRLQSPENVEDDALSDSEPMSGTSIGCNLSLYRRRTTKRLPCHVFSVLNIAPDKLTNEHSPR